VRVDHIRDRLGAEAICRNCGHKWLTVAKDVQCPHCKSRNVQVKSDLENVIPYLLGRILWDLEDIKFYLRDLRKEVKRSEREKG